MGNTRIKPGFTFLTAVPAVPAVAQTKAAVPEKKRSDEKVKVLHVYGKVSIPNDGDWNVAAVDHLGDARKYNPYILMTRDAIPAEGEVFSLPFAWDGMNLVSRKKAVRLAHAFNLAFKAE